MIYDLPWLYFLYESTTASIPGHTNVALDEIVLEMERPLLFVLLLGFDSFIIVRFLWEEISELAGPPNTVVCIFGEIVGNNGDKACKELKENGERCWLWFMPSMLPALLEVLVGIGGAVDTKPSMFKLCLETGTKVERFIGNLIELTGGELAIIPCEWDIMVLGSMVFFRNE